MPLRLQYLHVSYMGQRRDTKDRRSRIERGQKLEMTSIWEQVLDGNIAGVRTLLEDGVGVDERNWLGETPLHLAARYGLEDMATVRCSMKCVALFGILEGGCCAHTHTT